MDVDVAVELSEVVVDPKWCGQCRFYPSICQYYGGDAGNVSALISNPDGTCQKFQPKK